MTLKRYRFVGRSPSLDAVQVMARKAGWTRYVGTSSDGWIYFAR